MVQSTTATNERALERLARAIAFSQGKFSLAFVRCNYARLRGKMLHQLRTETLPHSFPNLGKIQSLVLPANTTRLYETIQTHLGDHHPAALMVLGLELVSNLEQVLTSANLVRDEFRKQLKFPVVLWVNDYVLQKLVKLAPDFSSFAANPVKFELSPEELKDLIQQKTDYVFFRILDPELRNVPGDEETPGCPIFYPLSFSLAQKLHRLELDSARTELIRTHDYLDPKLNASLQFFLGQDELANNEFRQAIHHFQDSLRYCRNHSNLERQAVLLYYIGLCYFRLGERAKNDHQRYWEDAWVYLNQSVTLFEQADRKDLIAQIIGQLGEVLQRLEAWDDLLQLTQRAVALHKACGTPLELAIDYGFLAKMALVQSRWAEAKELANTSLEIFANNPNMTVTATPLQPQPYSLYRLLWEQIFRLFLVKSQRRLGEFLEANHQLEKASQELEKALIKSDCNYDPYRYIRLLKGLRSLYFEEGRYREAFIIKKQLRSVEQQYGFRPFIGAGQLLPKRRIINPALTPTSDISNFTQSRIPEAISASTRRQDVNRLIARISRPDYKLIVIHGPSGVGKSSLVSAGLVPALQATSIGSQLALPVVFRVYTDIIGTLGHNLTLALQELLGIDSLDPLDSYSAILQQLQQNEEKNLLTLLILDQFEEFFFSIENLSDRKEFYEFFQNVLHRTGVKIIISIREDYLANLVELETAVNLEEIDSNPLDRKNRYPLDNFSKEDAYQVIKSLTQQANFDLEESLIQVLVEDLARGQGEVRPIELQIVGAQLQTENITTLDKYRQSGSIQKLVERFVEEVIQDCGLENEKTARRVLYLLTEENGTRPIKTQAELATDLATDGSHLDLILEIFIDSGLVTLIPENPHPCYQLVHDYLVGVIREREQLTIAEEREEFRRRNEQKQQEINQLVQQNEFLAEVAEARYKLVKEDLETFIPHPSKLGTLAEISAARKREELNQVVIEQLRQEKDLLAALAEAKQKRREGEKVLRRLLIGGILTLAASTALAIYQSRQAVISEIIALSASSEARFASHQELEALIDGLNASKKLKNPFLQAGLKAENQVLMALQQAVYQAKEQNRLEGHTDGVYSVSFSPDGQLIASASADKTFKIWQVNGQLINTITGHEDRVSSVSFSPDSQVIASASWDGTIKLWKRQDVLTNSNAKPFKTLEGHRDIVLMVSFSPDGQFLASASADNTVKLWRLEGSLFKTLRGHRAPVASLTWSPDSQTLATGSQDKTILIWRRDGTFQKTLYTSTSVESVSWSPDGQILASSGDEGTIQLWTPQGLLIRNIDAHNDPIFNLAWSGNSQMLASASQDNTIKLWNREGTFLGILQGHQDWVSNISFSPDGQTLASASRDKTVKLWRLYNPLLTVLKQQASAVNGVSFSPDGQWIVTAQKNNMIQLWRSDGTFVRTLGKHPDAVWSVNFSPDSQFIVSASADTTVKLWRLDGSLVRTFPGNQDSVLSASFSPNGELIASGGRDNTVRIWHINGQLLLTLRRHEKPVNWVSFSPDNQILASASEDGTVKLWNLPEALQGHKLDSASQVPSLSSVKVRGVLKGHTEGVWGVAWSPNGQLIATASPDRTVKLWSREGKLLNTLRGNTETVSTVAWSPDGQILASSGNDKLVRLWSRDGELLHILTGHRDVVTNVSFSPDGHTLASAAADGTVLLRDLTHLDLEDLQVRGCEWLADYLQHNLEAKGETDLGCVSINRANSEEVSVEIHAIP